MKEYNLVDIDQKKWEYSIRNVRELTTRIKKTGTEPCVKIKENLLIENTEIFNAYDAALIADFLRYHLIDQGVSFSFETVMSHRPVEVIL